MGYPGYFLIVWDFLYYARKTGVPVGPGRGSAAGSLVAYSLNITDIDPLKYGLLFERFLNPERVSLPDIDIDLCMDRRAEVIQYVTEKYGGNRNVAQIITFGSMNAKGVIRDVGRVLDVPYGEVDKLAKLIPNKLGITLKAAFDEVKDFQKLKKENETVKELLEIAVALEGLPRHCSIHAAGVVISSKQLTEFLPLYKGSADEVVTQFPMNTVEKLGLLKMDFLGLKTLTVIDNAVKKVKESLGIDLNIKTIPLKDEDTYRLLSEARSIGIFQLESSGMRDLLKKMKPDRFEDIVALLALYRPGPLESGMVDDYVKCKHGTQKVKYELPQLKAILAETHGVILYQEQVMKIASVLAGFTLGDADLLRRAMGKKKPEEMAKQREKFYSGCKENNIPEKKAQTIFDLMEKFAGYGFNKSHSAAYAMVSYQTAYLKAHYPLEFFGALISADMDNTDKVTRYINDCREMKINVLPPDVNKSFRSFTIKDGKLLFGLGAIKNVGSAAIDSIIETRKKTGTFESFSKFCEAADLRVANRRVMESLIKSGSMDSLESNRSHMFENLQTTMDLAQANQKDRALGQSSMFDLLGSADDPTDQVSDSNDDKKPDWEDNQRLKYEKETLGFFITGHPLSKFKRELSWFTDVGSAGLSECQSGQMISIGGIPSKILPKVTKRGDKMAFVTLEDLEGTTEITLWPETYALAEALLASEEPLLVKGKLEGDENILKVIVSAIHPLAEAKNHWRGKLRLSLRATGLEKQTLLEIKKILLEHPGKSEVQLFFTFPNNSTKLLSVGSDLTVTPSEEMVDQLESLLGDHSVRFE
jgi:DNA polymerase-3 subunit alpha